MSSPEHTEQLYCERFVKIETILYFCNLWYFWSTVISLIHKCLDPLRLKAMLSTWTRCDFTTRVYRSRDPLTLTVLEGQGTVICLAHSCSQHLGKKTVKQTSASRCSLFWILLSWFSFSQKESKWAGQHAEIFQSQTQNSHIFICVWAVLSQPTGGGGGGGDWCRSASWWDVIHEHGFS